MIIYVELEVYILCPCWDIKPFVLISKPKRILIWTFPENDRNRNKVKKKYKDKLKKVSSFLEQVSYLSDWSYDSSLNFVEFS